MNAWEMHAQKIEANRLLKELQAKAEVHESFKTQRSNDRSEFQADVRLSLHDDEPSAYVYNGYLSPAEAVQFGEWLIKMFRKDPT